MSKMKTAIAAVVAAMTVATAFPVQAFYTHDNNAMYRTEMRFMFACIRMGGSLGTCKAALQHERDKGTLY